MMRLLATVLLAFGIAQLLKVWVASVRQRRFTWQVVLFAGGIPSVHATLASSLAAGLLLEQGLTALSIATTVFAMLFIYDAMTLRRTVAEHQSMLRKIYERLGPKGVQFISRPGGIGHSPSEVFVGVTIGVLVASAMYREVIFLTLWLFLPAAIANMMPVVAQKLRGPGTPIAPTLLGTHKTWQGFAWGTVGGGLFFLLQQQLHSAQALGALPWYTGFVVGFGALLGDSVKSFFKRRLDIKPGKSWIPFDQADYIIGGGLALMLFVPLSIGFWSIILVGYITLHFATNQLAFAMGVRKEQL